MSLLTSAGPKHRADTVIAALRAENAELRAENGELRAMVINGDQHITASELRGMQTATELDTARQWIEQLEDAAERVDDLFAETVAGMQQQIDSLQRRLDIGVLAEHVVTRTQEIDTSTLQFPTVQERFKQGPVVRLGASPLADTQPVPRANQQKEVA